VTIDLESKCTIYAILVWHYLKEARAYADVVVQVADDPDFIGDVRTLFNNDRTNAAGQGIARTCATWKPPKENSSMPRA